MSPRECANCARPVQDGAPLCRTCTSALREALLSVPGLLDDLALTHARLDKIGAGGRGGESPLPWKDAAPRAVHAVGSMLVIWTRELAERWHEPLPNLPRRPQPALPRRRTETVRRCPISDLPVSMCAHCRGHHPGQQVHADEQVTSLATCTHTRPTPDQLDSARLAAAWLAERVTRIRAEADAKRCLTEITNTISRARLVIDLPQDRARFAVGPCPETDDYEQHCTGQVWAYVPIDKRDPAELRCRECGTKWDTTRWNRTGERIAARRRQLSEEPS